MSTRKVAVINQCPHCKMPVSPQSMLHYPETSLIILPCECGAVTIVATGKQVVGGEITANTEHDKTFFFSILPDRPMILTPLPFAKSS